MENIEEVLEGLILGDGFLTLRKKSKNASFGIKCNSIDYIEYIKNLLEENSFNIIGNKIYEVKNGYGTNFQYQIETSVNPYLTELHEKWYTPKKIVYKDVNLTPSCCKHWFIGDGYKNTTYGKFLDFRIAAHSFVYEDREILCNKLKSIGISVYNRNDGIISIHKKSCNNFLDYIGSSPVNFYNYKWEIQ